MITIKKHKLVFDVTYQINNLMRVYCPRLNVLVAYLTPVTRSDLSFYRDLYKKSKATIMTIRANEDRANEVS